MKLDDYGLRYVDSLPKEAQKAKTVWNLVEIDPYAFWFYRVKSLDVYVWSDELQRFEYYSLNHDSPGIEIDKMIKQDRVFFVSSSSQSKTTDNE